MDFKELQTRQGTWQAKNFPGAKNYQPLLGISEEVGELCHAHLKAEQGIRKNEDHEEMRKDAVGDIIIFLAGYCNLNGIDLQECVEAAFAIVEARVWNKE